jgi:hypothetical protein
MLLDLIETRGDKGKWFAVGKDPGFSISLSSVPPRKAQTHQR